MSERKHLFVIGCPRSGTTALGNLMNSHPSICLGVERYILRSYDARFELKPELYEYDRFFDLQDGDTFYEDMDKFYAGYETMREQFDQAEYVGDKIPILYESLDKLFERIPDAKVAFIYRNIFHVAASYIRRSKDKNDDTWPRDKGLEVALSDWTEAMQVLERFKNNSNVFPVCYETLFESKHCSEDLMDWLNLDYNSEFRDAFDQFQKRYESLASKNTLELTNTEIVDIMLNAPIDAYKNIYQSQKKKPSQVNEKNKPLASSKEKVTISVTEKTYEQRVEEQIAQYKDDDHIHASLGDSFSYWQKTHFFPYFSEVFGVNTPIEFYVKSINQGINGSGLNTVASIGSGDGAIEIKIAKALLEGGTDDFVFHLIELSPLQNERALKNVKAEGIEDYFKVIEADFNTWRADTQYASAIAHHALHHIVELEYFFDALYDGLHPNGTFATFDMIGRNGHMKWPENLTLTKLIWRFLPEDKRYHHILKRTDEEFVNFDCSTQGFEGIRAQDILPLLIKKFNFESFYAFGSLIDPFTGRGFGPNFDPNVKEDKAFLDFISELNELLIELGHLKPTRMAAIMTKQPVAEPRFYKGRSPEKMLRNVT